jgi:hypothetical protein
MSTPEKADTNPILFALLPVLTSIFFGLILVWRQDFSLTSVSFAFLMVLFSVVSGYFIWVWHTDHIEKLEKYHQRKYKEGLHMLTSYTAELERLLLTVEPKLAEQILAAKELTEQEISMLICRFSTMNEELKQIFAFANQAEAGQEPENFDNLKTSVGVIRKEIDIVLKALQFQDRVSQILMLVTTNLGALRKTLEHIQQQGPERHKNMLNVDAMIGQFQAQYEAVKHRGDRPASKQAADEATFF